MAKSKVSSKVIFIALGAVISLCALCTILPGIIYNRVSTDIGEAIGDPSDESISATDEVSNDTNNSKEDENSPITYQSDTDSGDLWVGSMAEKMFSPGKKMHATYTYKFGFELKDRTQSITKVEVTDIKASTSLPNGDLKILPYMHVSRSENGGSIISTAMYEDWNTYGYTYVSDYSKFVSLGDNYSPTICEEDVFCDYLDEVGQKGGYMSLRFKYVGVGNSISENPEYQATHVITAHGISPSQLSGEFSWTLHVTLSDGTVESKSYSSKIDGTTLDLEESNTVFFDL